MDFVLWGILPYLIVLILIAGLIWRYRYDQFGWTTRSSQLYESKMLKVASPLFHYGLLAVLMGHLMGLLIPKSWTDLVITQDTYHMVALYGGGLAGLVTIIGLGVLIYRRRRIGAVFQATTWNDKLVYVVLGSVLLLGMIATITGGHYPNGEHHNYRETVSEWFRSLIVFRPNVKAMTAATWQFQVHILIGMTLFALVPFSRLVHAFTAPLHYLFRPYVVYRTRDKGPAQPTGVSRRGWEPVGTPDRDRSSR